MNNKGQTLAIFVILLPVILFLIAVAIDMGNFLVQKNKYEDEVKNTIKYGLKHLDDEDISNKITMLLNSNVDGQKQINIKDKVIKIKVSKKVNSIFTNIIDTNYQIDISYIGYLDDKKIIIKKE